MIDKRNLSFNTTITSPASILGLKKTLQTIKEETKKGKYHLLIRDYQLIFGPGLNTNINIPHIISQNNNTFIIDLIVINNHKDAERLATKHLKKTPFLEPLLYNSIISTTDINDWRRERTLFQPAFNVNEVLKQLIPISNERAKYCSSLLKANINTNPININEFLLNETMAQLQLALFGLSNEFQEETNKKIRNTFNGEELDYAKDYYNKIMDEINSKKANGPLSNIFKSYNASNKELFGNTMIFSFAGHDTTGNTLSWLVYELCIHPEYQYQLQSEIELFWKFQGNNPIKYDDFKRLPFMTKCIMETLRLWSPIPNGTYRELIDDDYILNHKNEKVLIPKGTYIQIPNWTRHRDPDLWGPDSSIFNPNREFKDDELWNNSVINSYNPSSNRFSPFTYGPRDCIGKNFSQIEMRLILLHLLKDFSFSLTKEQLNKYKDDDMGLNTFTLGPRDIYDPCKNGLYVNIKSKL